MATDSSIWQPHWKANTLKLLFKFDEKASDADVQSLLRGLSSAGASRVYKLFETAKDPELASLYGLRCARPRAENIQEILDESSIVEYSETPPVRTLKRSGR